MFFTYLRHSGLVFSADRVKLNYKLIPALQISTCHGINLYLCTQFGLPCNVFCCLVVPEETCWLDVFSNIFIVRENMSLNSLGVHSASIIILLCIVGLNFYQPGIGSDISGKSLAEYLLLCRIVAKLLGMF